MLGRSPSMVTVSAFVYILACADGHRYYGLQAAQVEREAGGFLGDRAGRLLLRL
jgi:hypothetical protein